MEVIPDGWSGSWENKKPGRNLPGFFYELPAMESQELASC